ncbi:MAG: type II toxin-antitoxin system RelE/ParE family toxin [Kofleriaceae bacterium]
MHWREHADEAGVFAEEFLATVERLESMSTPGLPFPTNKRPRLRRMLMPKSRCHVYFEVDATKQTIQILHVWDGRRERAPKL